MTDQPIITRPAIARDMPLSQARRAALHVLPGVALCGGVTAVAYGLEAGEAHLFGRAWLEALVLAILVGTAVRTLWTPGTRFRAGITFGAKQMLEVAVALLGLSISFSTLAEVGPGLLFGIAGVVALAIPTSFGICRLLGLPKRMAVLVACGNSICGNSAIAAVAPTIGADGDDVAASIAFTAVLGVLVVLGLPALAPLLHMSQLRFGALAGLTVYAVPQVLAAAAPVGPAAVQIGTLVKLVRVLMLGPVVLALSMLASRLRDEPDELAPQVIAGDRPKAGHVAIHRMMPPFILAFLAFATLRSAGLVPAAVLPPVATVANVLTILSMAALGLGVDVRVVAKAGLRVTGAVTLSLIALGGLSLALIHALGLA
jgi:uncharacterized integral membrane protein (TIGR00698 family)